MSEKPPLYARAAGENRKDPGISCNPLASWEFGAEPAVGLQAEYVHFTRAI